MITASEIVQLLKNENIETTDQDVQDVLDGLDIESLQQVEASKYEYLIWDKQSPINQASASAVIQSLVNQGIDTSSEMYLIKEIGGNVIYFQPHAPNVSGYVKMDQITVVQYAEENFKNFLQNIVNSIIIKTVKEELNK